MDRSQHRRRQINRFRPQAEPVESRFLLTLGGYVTGALGPSGFLYNPPGTQAVRPNTPVLPYAASLSSATFIDPSVTIIHGQHVVVGPQTYVGPYATLNASTGFIKIGGKSIIQANATVVSNPLNIKNYPTNVEIGDQVSVGYGATVHGPSLIGAYGAAAKPTGIGANALIENAVIKPGAIVGALARVGPGVTVPSGYYVLPGSNVTNDAEASNPALGKVELIPAAVQVSLATTLARSVALAAGYTNLYQGNAATGASIGTITAGINHGNISTVEGASPEPGASTATATTGIAFEPTGTTQPSFVGPYKPSVAVNLYNFPARVIGGVTFNARVNEVSHTLGRRNAILGDQGQRISFASAPTTGNAVTIASPGGGVTTTTTTTTTYGVTSTKTTTTSTGAIKVGAGFVVGGNAVVLGGTAASYAIGDNVAIGAGAVVSNSSIAVSASVGTRAYVSGSTITAGQVIPPGAIVVNNVYLGQVQW